MHALQKFDEDLTCVYDLKKVRRVAKFYYLILLTRIQSFLQSCHKYCSYCLRRLKTPHLDREPIQQGQQSQSLLKAGDLVAEQALFNSLPCSLERERTKAPFLGCQRSWLWGQSEQILPCCRPLCSCSIGDKGTSTATPIYDQDRPSETLLSTYHLLVE